MALIDDLRAKYRGYDDNEILSALQATKYQDYSLQEIGDAIGYKPKAGVLRTAGDVALKLGQGVVGLGESAVGLADLVTGGYAGRGLAALGYDPNATNEFIGQGLSDAQKVSDQRVAEADGFGDTVVAAVQNPRSILGAVAESAPMVLASGGASSLMARTIFAKAAAAAGGAGTAAGQAAGQAAVEAAAGRLMWAGAGSEGAMTAGSIAEQARQTDPEDPAKMYYGVPAGIGTALIGRAAGRLMGDAETAIFTGAKSAGVKGSLPARVGKAMFSEGVLEEMPQSAQEQVFTNLATGKPAGEGVGNAAGMGLVTGAAMGGGMAMLQGRSDESLMAQAQRVLQTTTDVGEMTQAAAEIAMVPLAPIGAAAQPAGFTIPGPGDSGVQLPLDDGAAFEQRAADTPPEPTGQALPTDILNVRGEPFTTMRRAMRAQAAAGEGHEIVRVADGLVVRPATAAPTGNRGELDAGPDNDPAPGSQRQPQDVDLQRVSTVADVELPPTLPPARRATAPGSVTPDVGANAGGVLRHGVMQTAALDMAAVPGSAVPSPAGDLLLTADGMPYGTRSSAYVRAKKEGGTVIPVAGGWAVQPENALEPVSDLAGTAVRPAAAIDGQGDQPGRGGGIVRPGAAVAGPSVPGTAAPDAGGVANAPVADGSAEPHAALNPATVAGLSDLRVRVDAMKAPAQAAPVADLKAQWMDAVKRGDTAGAAAINEQIIAAKAATQNAEVPVGATPTAQSSSPAPDASAPLKERVDARRKTAAPAATSAADLPTQPASGSVPAVVAGSAAQPDIFMRAATKAERTGNVPKQRAMREAAPRDGYKAVFKPYGADGAGFYYTPTGESTAAPSANKVGDLVKLTKPGLNGRVNIAGTITQRLPDGRLEIRTQNDGYMTVAESDLGHKLASQPNPPASLNARVEDKKNPEQRSAAPVAESQAPDTAKALETGDGGLAPTQASAAPDPATTPAPAPAPATKAKKPPKSFRKKVKVQTDVFVEESAQFDAREIDADAAITAIDEDLAELEEFRKCIAGG